MPSTPSQPDQPARGDVLRHVFLDRSLGAVQVPAIVRQAGIVLTTMREHYGEAKAQHITDVDLAARFICNLRAIVAAAEEPGPYIYSVQSRGIARLL